MNTKLFEKIRKLQAKANDKSITQEEAALFAEKVQELLAEHNIEIGTLDQTRDDEKADPVETQIYGKSYGFPWRANLAKAVAQLYFCDVFNHFVPPKKGEWNRRKYFAFVGKATNRAVAIQMYEFFDRTIVNLSKNYVGSREDMLAFQRGCGLELSRRIHGYRVEQQNHPTSQVPALYNMEQRQVEDYLRSLNLTKSKPHVYNQSKAALDGKLAAHGINIRGPNAQLAADTQYNR